MSRRAPAWTFAALALLLAAPAFAADTVYYYSSDTLHSEVVVTDQSRNVVERTYYAPYGAVLNRDLRDGPGYTGHEEDPETNLVYMQQRYYDPEAGRFLSIDPVQADGGGGSFNRYAYASDNPYTYDDPFGEAATQATGRIADAGKPCTGSHIGGQACGAMGPLSPSLLKLNEGSDIFQVAGKAIATDVAYIQGLVTHNQALQDAAASGFEKEIGTKTAFAAIFALGTMGKGGEDVTVEGSTGFISDATVVSRGNVIGRGTVDVRGTVAGIASGRLAPRDVFENRQGLLPIKPAGYYQEFVHPTPGIFGAGPQRIISGQGGELYYTPDHYDTFIPLNPR